MSRKRHNLYRIPIHLFFVILSSSFVIPLLMLLSISFTEEASIYEYGYRLFPRKLSTIAYEFVFRNPQQIVNAYGVTIYITLIGTFLSVLLMLMCAYSLSRKCFAYRRFVSGYLFFTMLFGGGLVPSYILTTQVLHLQDTLLVFILNSLVSAWNIFILRTLISDIPEAIIESAYIDGASEYRIFFSLHHPPLKARHCDHRSLLHGDPLERVDDGASIHKQARTVSVAESARKDSDEFGDHYKQYEYAAGFGSQ